MVTMSDMMTQMNSGKKEYILQEYRGLRTKYRIFASVLMILRPQFL